MRIEDLTSLFTVNESRQQTLANRSITFEIAPEMHRNIYRGKNLGNEVTEQQLKNINNGTFEDLFVGDYWEINNIKWRIGDINYFKGLYGFNTNHLVIIPDYFPYEETVFNPSAHTTDQCCWIFNNNDGVINTIPEVLRNITLTHTEYYVVNNNNLARLTREYPYGLCDEITVFGSRIYGKPNVPATNNTQFALFKLNPNLIINGEYYFLNTYSGDDNHILGVTSDGIEFYTTSKKFAGRPYFCIGIGGTEK